MEKQIGLNIQSAIGLTNQLQGAAKVLGQMFQLKFSRKVQIFLSIFLLDLAA